MYVYLSFIPLSMIKMEKEEKANPVIAALEKRQQQEEIRRQERRSDVRNIGKMEGRIISGSGKSDDDNRSKDVSNNSRDSNDIVDTLTNKTSEFKDQESLEQIEIEFDSECQISNNSGDDEEEDSADLKLMSLAPLNSISVSPPFLPQSS
jgi:hypothetical protein